MPENYRDGFAITTLLNRCRELRRESTDGERVLWYLLRRRQLAGLKFRRQHQFGRFVLDFFCPERRLAIELDGSQHFLPEGVAKDAARTAYLEARNLRVLRFTNLEVLTETEAVLERIWQEVSQQAEDLS